MKSLQRKATPPHVPAEVSKSAARSRLYSQVYLMLLIVQLILLRTASLSLLQLLLSFSLCLSVSHSLLLTNPNEELETHDITQSNILILSLQHVSMSHSLSPFHPNISMSFNYFQTSFFYNVTTKAQRLTCFVLSPESAQTAPDTKTISQ